LKVKFDESESDIRRRMNSKVEEGERGRSMCEQKSHV